VNRPVVRSPISSRHIAQLRAAGWCSIVSLHLLSRFPIPEKHANTNPQLPSLAPDCGANLHRHDSTIRTAGSCAIILAALFRIEARAQILKSQSPATSVLADNTLAQHTVALIVPKGTALQVALDSEVRVKKVGQPLHGHLMQPVYAFDRPVLPLGTRVRVTSRRSEDPAESNLHGRS
jgi:hypothetical protein